MQPRRGTLKKKSLEKLPGIFKDRFFGIHDKTAISSPEQFKRKIVFRLTLITKRCAGDEIGQNSCMFY